MKRERIRDYRAGHNVWHGRLQKKDGVEFTQFNCSKGLNTSLKAKVFFRRNNVAFWEFTYYSWSILSNQGFFALEVFFLARLLRCNWR